MEKTASDEELATFQPIVKLYLSCADQDGNILDQLSQHLSPLRALGYISVWHKQEILPGAIKEQEVTMHLNNADLFVPLLSVNFVSSTDCWQGEMGNALQRWEQGEMTIVPVLASPVDCNGTPISNFSVLPANARAITDWTDRKQACDDVARGIRKVVELLLAKKWQQHGNICTSLEQYEQALLAYEKALGLDPRNPSLYNDKGDILFYLKHFENSIAMYNEAIALDPDFGLAYKGRGRALEAFAPLAREKCLEYARQSYAKATALEKDKRGRGRQR